MAGEAKTSVPEYLVDAVNAFGSLILIRDRLDILKMHAERYERLQLEALVNYINRLLSIADMMLKDKLFKEVIGVKNRVCMHVLQVLGEFNKSDEYIEALCGPVMSQPSEYPPVM